MCKELKHERVQEIIQYLKTPCKHKAESCGPLYKEARMPKVHIPLVSNTVSIFLRTTATLHLAKGSQHTHSRICQQHNPTYVRSQVSHNNVDRVKGCRRIGYLRKYQSSEYWRKAGISKSAHSLIQWLEWPLREAIWLMNQQFAGP